MEAILHSTVKSISSANSKQYDPNHSSFTQRTAAISHTDSRRDDLIRQNPKIKDKPFWYYDLPSSIVPHLQRCPTSYSILHSSPQPLNPDAMSSVVLAVLALFHADPVHAIST